MLLWIRMNYSNVALMLVTAALLHGTSAVRAADVAAAQGRGAVTSQSTEKTTRRVGKLISDQYTVVLAADEDSDAIGREAEQLFSGRLKHVYRHTLRGFTIRLSRAAADKLGEDPRVLFVEEDGVVQLEQASGTWGL